MNKDLLTENTGEVDNNSESIKPLKEPIIDLAGLATFMSNLSI